MVLNDFPITAEINGFDCILIDQEEVFILYLIGRSRKIQVNSKWLAFKLNGLCDLHLMVIQVL